MDTPNIVGYNVNKAELFKKLRYSPMEHQWSFHNCETRFRCAVCGRRTGKTVMVANDRTAELLKPDTLGWIVGPTYDLAAKEFKVIYTNLIRKFGLEKDKRVKKNFNIRQGDMYIEMPWGARVEVRSAAKPETLVGEGLDWIIVSEAAKQSQETWEMYLRPALSDHRGSADFVTTPEGKNWLYKLWMLYKTQKDYTSWRFPSWVNTAVFPGGYEDEEIQLMKDTTIEEWFLQEIAAEFTAIVGRIFGEYSDEDHVMAQKHEFRPDWPNYIMFDWGFTNPLAAMEVQISPRDEIFVWREHYATNQTLEWHINEIKNRINPEGYHLDLAFGDAADPEAVEYVSQHLVPCMAEPESKDWMPGIRLMKEFLQLHHDGISYDEIGVPIMRPRYHVDPDCTYHNEEMLAYKAKKTVSPNLNEYKGAQVVDPKCADHSIDAIRYGLMHLYKIGVSYSLADARPDWINERTPRERIVASSANHELATAGVGGPATTSKVETMFSMTRQRGTGPGGRF